MPPSVYQHVVNLTVSILLWKGSSVFMNISIREHCGLATICSDVAKFATVTPLSLLFSCKLALPNCRFQNITILHSSLLTEFSCGTKESDGKPAIILHRNSPLSRLFCAELVRVLKDNSTIPATFKQYM
jgi:hypothetical protein